MDISWVLKPLMGGVIGYTTNYLAIKMLFRPHTAKYIGKFRVPFTPGLIPKERERIANSLGETVGNKLLTEEVILNELANERVIQSLKDYVIKELIGDRIRPERFISQFFQETELNEWLFSISVTLTEELAGSNQLPDLVDRGIKQVFQYDMTIAAMMSPEANEKIRGIIQSKGKVVSEAVVSFLQKEEIQNRMKEMLSKLISEKLGFAAMFIQAESIVKMINEHLNDYLKKEENHEKVAKLLTGMYDELGNKKISQILSPTEYDEVVEEIGHTLHIRVQELVRSQEMKQMIVELLKKLLNKEIRIPEEIAQKIDRAIEGIYLKFVRNHLPLFLQEFNVSNIVKGEINAFSVEEVENLIFQIVDKELNAITWLGALLGFVMACLLLVVG